MSGGNWQIRVRSHVIQLKQEISPAVPLHYAVTTGFVNHQLIFGGQIISCQAPLTHGLLSGVENESFLVENPVHEFFQVDSPGQTIEINVVDLKTHRQVRENLDISVFLFIERV
jgi:hypothetical protein